MKWVYYIVLFLVFCGPLGAAVGTPGVRHFSGRVIKRSGGQLDVFNGWFCARFPAEKTSVLGPFLGEFVDVAFTEVASRISYTGTTFGEINHVTTITESPDEFPIEVKIEPAKKVFTTSEPIIARVTLENRSNVLCSIMLTSSHAIVSQDYERVFWMEPDNHDYPEKSYTFIGKPNYGNLKPGERIEFTVESRHMAEPGDYDLSYALNRGANIRDCTSALAQFKVVRPENSNRIADLKLWLKKASAEERIKIIEELAKIGDHEAIDEFLEQLKAGIYLGNGFFYQEAYRFAFQYGGEKGEKLMMKIIQQDKFQESAKIFISFATLTKNRNRLFEKLLSCEHAVEMPLQDWIDGTRICDITADYLMQSAERKMKFPRDGSVFDRNKAVQSVQLALKKEADIFSVLKKPPGI